MINRQALPGHVGIIIFDTFNDNQPIYNNEIFKCDTGIRALNKNRTPSFPPVGAEFRCNAFSGNIIDVEVNGLIPTCTTCGVSQTQGEADESAGNEFEIPQDPLVTEHLVNFFGNASHTYNRLNTPSTTEPANSETENYSLIQVSFANPCDEEIPDIPNADIPFEIYAFNLEQDDLADQYATKYNQWLALVDGGDTDALTAEVIETEFSEALELHYELMAKSPNLSEQVMIEAIEKEYDLPMVLLKQILQSNPQAAKSSKVKDKLDARLMPLPEYMKQEIMEGLNWVSQKENLETDMVNIKREYHQLERLYMHHILEDSLILDKQAELIAVINSSPFGEPVLEKVKRTYRWGDLNPAITLAQTELNQLDATSESYQLTYDLLQVLEIEQQINEQDLSTTDAVQAVQNLRLNPDFTQSALSIELEEKLTGNIVLEHVYYPQVQMEYRGSLQEPLETELPINIYPNPVTDLLVVELGNMPLTESACVEILDNTGKIIEQVKISDTYQQVVDVSTLNTGLYHFLLKDQGQLIVKQYVLKSE